jgi:hypothetical protein
VFVGREIPKVTCDSTYHITNERRGERRRGGRGKFIYVSMVMGKQRQPLRLGDGERKERGETEGESGRRVREILVLSK